VTLTPRTVPAAQAHRRIVAGEPLQVLTPDVTTGQLGLVRAIDEYEAQDGVKVYDLTLESGHHRTVAATAPLVVVEDAAVQGP
jgi:hypothetical protein